SVDVDELAEFSLVVVEPFLEAREFLVELVQRLRDVTCIDLDDSRTAGQLPERAGHTDLDRHVVLVIIRRMGGPAPYPPPLAGEGRLGLSATRRGRPGPSCPVARRSSRRPRSRRSVPPPARRSGRSRRIRPGWHRLVRARY